MASAALNAAANPDGSGAATVGLTHSPDCDVASGSAFTVWVGWDGCHLGARLVPVARGRGGCCWPPNLMAPCHPPILRAPLPPVAGGPRRLLATNSDRPPAARGTPPPHARPHRLRPSPPPAVVAALGLTRILSPLSCQLIDLILLDHNRLQVRGRLRKVAVVVGDLALDAMRRRQAMAPNGVHHIPEP